MKSWANADKIEDYGEIETVIITSNNLHDLICFAIDYNEHGFKPLFDNHSGKRKLIPYKLRMFRRKGGE